MLVHMLPSEILDNILSQAARMNGAEGGVYTYGLSQALLPLDKSIRLSRYVRGPLGAEALAWDATWSIRQVCSRWHAWAIARNFRHVFERKRRGAERWVDLTSRRSSYSLYELIDRPQGVAVYRDPYLNLKRTQTLLSSAPNIAQCVRRLWFNGFHSAETDSSILSIIANCPNLDFLSIPWTILRRGTVGEWFDLLKVDTGAGRPLQSLEVQCMDLSSEQDISLAEDNSTAPLKSPRISFRSLRRLKILGNSQQKPVSDEDLIAIARTANNLECLDLTNVSTVSLNGLLRLVRASYSTLKILEHSPRSRNGFHHPHPGNLSSTEHSCLDITGMPLLRDVSLSLPKICHCMFNDHTVSWTGYAQFRFRDICGVDPSPAPSTANLGGLLRLLRAARGLIDERVRSTQELHIELFFAGFIFEPAKRRVHGDFSWINTSTDGLWLGGPREYSYKGPYGSSGYYGKEGDGWVVISEHDFFHSIEEGWFRV